MRLPRRRHPHADRWRTGIGRALALELAGLGFNVVVHARTLLELEPVQSANAAAHPARRVVCLAHDCTKPADWDALLAPLAGLRLTLLINNVATSPPLTAFASLSDDQIEGTARANALFPAQLARRLLPALPAAAPALVLNMCSASTRVPMPCLAPYIASKAYLDLWARSLRVELLMLHWDVECKVVNTGEVSSSGHAVPTGFFTPTAAVYARSLLARAGMPGPAYDGYWRHGILVRHARCWCAFR